MYLLGVHRILLYPRYVEILKLIVSTASTISCGCRFHGDRKARETEDVMPQRPERAVQENQEDTTDTASTE